VKWIIGLDLREQSGGALWFADWLARAGTAERFVPVHVLERGHLLLLLRHRHLDEVLADTRAAAERAIAAQGCATRFPDVRIVQADRAEEALARASGAESADALIIGRIAKRGSHPLVRLGRVARRLVRHLPAVVVITPPDLVDVGSGRVVALTSLDDDSLRACRFARDLSLVTSRTLAVLHVMPDPADALAYGLPNAAVDKYRLEARAAARTKLADWLMAAEVEAALTDVLVGDVVEQALAFSDEHDAAMIVTGATRRHSAQRIYAPSVGRELAAAAARPVAIVPADGA
jgi:nucleotide-binding universal stress UspA family protein